MNPIESAIIAWVLSGLPALIAIVALIYENRRYQTTLQTQLLINLNDQWCSRELKRLRIRVALNLLRKQKPNFELGELLDFFSMIGYLYKSKAVNTSLLDNQFGWWFIRYWLCAKEWVLNIRKIDPEGWKNVETVANRLIAMEQKGGLPVPPTPEQLRYFLKVESKLFI